MSGLVFPHLRRGGERFLTALIASVVAAVVTMPLTLLHGWVIMLALGALSHELDRPVLALSLWQAILLRIAVSWLIYQHDFKD